MIYLLTMVLCIVAFMQTLRYGQLRELHVYSVIAVNYVVATAAVFGVSGLHTITGTLPMPWHSVAAGAATGALYFTHILITLGCFRTAGVGVTVAVGGCSLIIPAVVGWAVWEESMTVYRWIALVLVPPATWIMRPGNGMRPRLTLVSDALLFANFAAAGLVSTMQKYADVHFFAESKEVFKVSLFGFAAVCSIVFTLLRKLPLRRRDVGVGVVLGLINAASLIFTLLALQVIASVVLFPTSMCLVICINTALSRFLWKERLKPRQYVGIAFAMLIIVLINLPG